VCNNGFVVNVFLICSYQFSRSDPDKHSRVRRTLQHSLFTWLLSQTATTVFISRHPNPTWKWNDGCCHSSYRFDSTLFLPRFYFGTFKGINIRVCEERCNAACLPGYFLKQLQQFSFLDTPTQRGNGTTAVVTHTGLTVQCFSQGFISAPSRECCTAL
jgi:hypothetical protein